MTIVLELVSKVLGGFRLAVVSSTKVESDRSRQDCVLGSAKWLSFGFGICRFFRFRLSADLDLVVP